MKYRVWTALLCCLLMLSGCKQTTVTKQQEDSAGTGYGVTQKSALMLQDLYSLRPGLDREEVEQALGSPQSFLMAENNQDTYRLSTGETLVITYTELDRIERAVYTDISGRRQDFFAVLKNLGILKNYRVEESLPEENTPETPEEQAPVTTPEEETPVVQAPTHTAGTGSFFSTKQYTYEVADQILALGAERETVVSAFGKPNAFSSVNFAKDSYLVDVYAMNDGSTLLLDYGYNRTKLRAVQQIKGTEAISYLGNWGAESKPTSFYRNTRNQQVFTNLQKGTKPAELYRRLGEPDWLEGSADRYRDAYQLLNGAVFYLDFGPDHNSLTAAVMHKADGTIVNYTLR